MFDVKDWAVARFEQLRKRHKQIHKTIGTHLAEGAVTPADGLATPIDQGHHFSFFEAAESDICASFRIVEVLYDD